MSFNDIFKSSFLENAVEFSMLDIVLAMAISFMLGLFIFYVYQRTYAGVMYSASFGVSIIAMTLITTLIILAVTSNLVLSLGMVGALSVVRFRTAIKEPLDIAFIFWAMSVGIVMGAGLIPLAVIGSIVIGIVILIFANRQSADTPYMLILQILNEEVENKAMDIIVGNTKKSLIKSKTVSRDNIELMIDIRLNDESTKLVNYLAKMEGIQNATLVTYNGDYMA